MRFLPTFRQVTRLLTFSLSTTRSSKSAGSASTVTRRSTHLILTKSLTTSTRLRRNIRTNSRTTLSSFSSTSNSSLSASPICTILTTTTSTPVTNTTLRASISTSINSSVLSKNGSTPNLYISKRDQAATAASTTSSTSSTPPLAPLAPTSPTSPTTVTNSSASGRSSASSSHSQANQTQPIGKKLPKSRKNKKRLFSYHAYAIPKPNHLKKGRYGKNDTEFGFAGEDAYFAKLLKPHDSRTDAGEDVDVYHKLRSYKSLIIGVADGVGNRRESQQLQSAKFAQQLMQESLGLLARVEADSQLIEEYYKEFHQVDPNTMLSDDENVEHIKYKYSYNEFETQWDGVSRACMSRAMDRVVAKGGQGASTLCTVTLEFPQISQVADTRYDPKLLHACNLGDSGFAIFRRGLGTHRDDLHYIDKMAARSEGSDMDHSKDEPHDPKDANLKTKDVQDLDVLENELKTEADMADEDLTFAERIRKAFESDYEGPRVGMPRLARDTDYFMLYRSPTQIKDFGVPYQFGSHSTSNTISDAVNINGIELESEDIVVIGTDGLWDNLFSNEIANIISDSMKKFDDKQSLEKDQNDAVANRHSFIRDGKITNRLMKQAYENSLNRSGVTPWSLFMTDTVEMIYSGGKHDDITCAVIYIH